MVAEGGSKDTDDPVSHTAATDSKETPLRCTHHRRKHKTAAGFREGTEVPPKVGKAKATAAYSSHQGRGKFQAV